MATYTGFATVVGISSGGATVDMGKENSGTGLTSMFGYAAVFLDSLPVQHTSTFVEHVGANGRIQALQWNNEYLELSVTFRPIDKTSISAAAANMFFIPKGGRVQLSGFKVVDMYHNNASSTAPAAPYADVLNQDWLNVGDATLALNASTPGEVQLQLRHYLSKQANLIKPIS